MSKIIFILSFFLVSFQIKAGLNPEIHCKSSVTNYSYQIFPSFGEIYVFDENGHELADFDGLSNVSQDSYSMNLYDFEDEVYYMTLVAVSDQLAKGYMFLGEIADSDPVSCIAL